MLVQAAVIVTLFSNMVSSTIPQEFFAVTNIKEAVHDLKKQLDDFHKHMTIQIRDYQSSLWENRKENESPEKHMNHTFCLQSEIPKARMEVNRLLNMLVEGEKNELANLETSLIKMKFPTSDEESVHELHRLWGSLAAHGKSKRKIKAETKNMETMARKRFEEIKKICKEPKINTIS